MTGDRPDVLARLKGLLPGGWFRDPTPVLDGTLAGISEVLSNVYALIAFARLQTRIRTATGGFLDLVSLDYFGPTLPRHPAETDPPFRARILANLFLEKGTRAGLIRALTLLTGRAPLVFEPARPADTGAYNTNSLGYAAAGGYGSLLLPYQAFVTAYRPMGQGIPLVAGYGVPAGGYGAPSRASYASLDQIIGPVTDRDILDTIRATMPAATVAWTRVVS